MRVFFVVLSYVVFLLALPFLLGHPKLRHDIRERFAWYRRGWPHIGPGPRVWFHGASAGDILALLPTVRALKEQRPDAQIIASTITDSGRTILNEHAALFAAHFYIPYDLPDCVGRALRRLRPDLIVLEYTELWPHLIAAARARRIPVVLHNGRLSRAQLRRYRLLFRLTGNLLQCMRLLLLRDAGEAERALALGAAPEKIVVAGNTKFDRLVHLPEPAAVEALRSAAGLAPDARVWVAGSTHDGEEDALLRVFKNLRTDFPDLRMILGPRYVDRAERLLSMVHRHGLTGRLRSKPGAAADVLVLDVIGEMVPCYALATVVFVGGSFVMRGGQNILEPAAAGKPVIFGPHMHNFADALQVLLGRGGIQVANPVLLERVIRDLLHRDDYRHELGELAQAQVMAIRGAARRNADRLAELIAPRAKPPAAAPMVAVPSPPV